jgi:hypothetical protein
MSENRRRGARRAQPEHQAPQEEAAPQQHLPPPPPMTIEQMFMIQTEAVQAIGQTLAAMQQVQQQPPPPPQPPVQVQMPQVPRDKRAEFMRGHPLFLTTLLIPWTLKIGCTPWSVSCTLPSVTTVRRYCMVPDS